MECARWTDCLSTKDEDDPTFCIRRKCATPPTRIKGASKQVFLDSDRVYFSKLCVNAEDCFEELQRKEYLHYVFERLFEGVSKRIGPTMAQYIPYTPCSEEIGYSPLSKQNEFGVWYQTVKTSERNVLAMGYKHVLHPSETDRNVTLAKLAERDRLSTDQLRDFSTRLAILDAVCSRIGIRHNDLHQNNLFVQYAPRETKLRDRLCVIDWGLTHRQPYAIYRHRILKDLVQQYEYDKEIYTQVCDAIDLVPIRPRDVPLFYDKVQVPPLCEWFLMPHDEQIRTLDEFRIEIWNEYRRNHVDRNHLQQILQELHRRFPERVRKTSRGCLCVNLCESSLWRSPRCKVDPDHCFQQDVDECDTY